MAIARTAAVTTVMAVLVSVPRPAAAVPVVIDPFESGAVAASDSTNDNVAVAATQTGLADVLGGQRTVRLNLRQAGTVSATLTPTAADDAIALVNQQTSSTPVGTASTVAGLEYGPASPQMNANLTAGGNDRFSITLAAAPVGGFVLFQVSAVGGGGATYTVTTAAGPGTYEAPFAAFTPIGSSFNFADVDGIALAFGFSNTALTGTYAPSDLRVVPEPAVTALAGVAAAGLLGRRRRHRTSVG